MFSEYRHDDLDVYYVPSFIDTHNDWNGVD